MHELPEKIEKRCGDRAVIIQKSAHGVLLMTLRGLQWTGVATDFELLPLLQAALGEFLGDDGCPNCRSGALGGPHLDTVEGSRGAAPTIRSHIADARRG